MLTSKHHRAARRAKCIRRICIYIAVGDEVGLPALRRIGENSDHILMAEALAFVSERVCYDSLGHLRRIVRHYRIDKRLLKQAERSQGAERAFMLALLSRLPMHMDMAEEIFRLYKDDPDRQVRFYALLCTIASDKEFIRRVTSFRGRMTLYEVSELISMLCRGVCTIAYTPMIRSSNYNLCLLGIYIIRRLGAVDAERELRRVIIKGPDNLRLEALYALASLRGNISGTGLKQWIDNRPRTVRRSLCHHFVRSGYSLRTLHALFGTEECSEAERMLNTYKCRIA